MKEIEVKALAKIEKVPSVDSITIDSDHLVGYLIARGFVAKESQFSPSLDLSRFTAFIEDLYIERQEGFVSSKENRTILLEAAEWIRTTSGHNAKFVTKGMIRNLEMFANRKADVESSSVIYFDTNEKVITVSPINFGEFERVEVSTLDILKKGNLPMIEIHTHPSDNLFSPIDYLRMLVDLDCGTPVVKSIMVLCPNMQVLALATRETPALDVDEANERLEVLDRTYSVESLKERMLTNKYLSVEELMNQMELEIAQSLHVKLYSSTDMQHFKEFSA